MENGHPMKNLGEWAGHHHDEYWDLLGFSMYATYGLMATDSV
jgi:hypothetical protein